MQINNEFKFAKRNGFINETENFFNYQLIKDKLITGINQLSIILNTENLIVYGELFGGIYPVDSEMKTFINNGCVQKGVYYSPDVNFIVFDIIIVQENGEHSFLNYYEMERCVKQTQLMYSKALAIDTFSNIIQFNTKINSTIPKELGLETLKEGTNIIEGIVIKPIENYIINENDKYTRCLIKIKNKEFLEISTKTELNEISYKSILIGLINENRLNSVISKIGELTNENREEIIDEFVQDVWADYFMNYSNIKIDNYDKAQNIIIENINKLL